MTEIKKKRLEKGMTQIEVAIACKVSLSTYRLWESGVMQPKGENQARLNTVLGLEEERDG